VSPFSFPASYDVDFSFLFLPTVGFPSKLCRHFFLPRDRFLEEGGRAVSLFFRIQMEAEDAGVLLPRDFEGAAPPLKFFERVVLPRSSSMDPLSEIGPPLWAKTGFPRRDFQQEAAFYSYGFFSDDEPSP